MTDRVKSITENTLIPISALVLFFGCAAWLTRIYFQGEANANEIIEIKEMHSMEFDKIDNKLEKLNDKLDRLLQKQRLQ